jgi:hypothetical protein
VQRTSPHRATAPPTEEAYHDPEPGAVAAAGGDGLLCLSRGAQQPRRPGSVSVPYHGALEAHAHAAQPDGPHGMGPDQQARGPVAAKATHPSPLAKPALRRQTSKVGAGCGNAARPVRCGGCPVLGISTAVRPTAPMCPVGTFSFATCFFSGSDDKAIFAWVCPRIGKRIEHHLLPGRRSRARSRAVAEGATPKKGTQEILLRTCELGHTCVVGSQI